MGAAIERSKYERHASESTTAAGPSIPTQARWLAAGVERSATSSPADTPGSRSVIAGELVI
jgi:hypothetical protein